MPHVLTILKLLINIQELNIYATSKHTDDTFSSSQLMTLLLLLKSLTVCTWVGQCDVFSGESY